MKGKRGVLGMTPVFSIIMAILLVPLVLLGFLGCGSPTAATKPQVTTTVVEEPDQTLVANTYETTAEVTNIDVRERRVTLTFKDGSTHTFTVGDEARNFDQLRVGDEVYIAVYEELHIFLAGHGAAPRVDHAAALGLAPKGDKPGIVAAGMTQITARIVDVDVPSRQVTLELDDGSMKTVPVRNRKVDVTQLKVGDNVAIQVTEAVMIQVKQP